MRIDLALALAAAAAAVAAMPAGGGAHPHPAQCEGPRVRIDSPKHHAVLPGAATLHVLFTVECAEFPGAVFVRLWDATTMQFAGGQYVDMHTEQMGVLGNVEEGTSPRVCFCVWPPASSGAKALTARAQEPISFG